MQRRPTPFPSGERRLRLQRGIAVSLIGLSVLGAAYSPYPQDRRNGDVVYIPTPEEVVEKMLELAQLKSTDIVYDLGSGDGRIPIMAAQTFGARGVGIEINPVLVREAQENARAAGVSHLVRFIEADLFQADLREATVVTLFLLESLNERLRPKLLAELRPGSRIVSHEYGIGGWRPEKSVEIVRRMVHLWTVPPKQN
jgi:SAM-dependent methyltransferase